MKRSQIKELAQSIAVHGGISGGAADRILNIFSRSDLKIFARLLFWEIKNGKVTASYAGNIDIEHKKKIMSFFPDKNVEFKRDDENIGAGLKLEYGDFVLDCSISGIMKRLLSNVKEML